MRTIAPALAPILEELELNQPVLVTREDVDQLRQQVASTSPTPYLIEQLIKAGWLLRLRTRGVWEFAPASRAGAFGGGDRFIELRAALRKRPQLRVAVAVESAAWLHGLSGRVPTRDVIATEPHVDLPPALSEFRMVRHSTRLPSVTVDGLPVWSVTTLLVAMALRPSSYKDWPNVTDWLSEAVHRVDIDDVRSELEDAPRASWARCAYLLASGGRESDAIELLADAPMGSGPYYLGRRDRPGTHDQRFDIIDSALVRSAK